LSSFKDFFLKEELLRAVKEAAFEKPSEGDFYKLFFLIFLFLFILVQTHCIPYAL